MNSFYDDFCAYTDSAKRVGWYDKLDQELKFALVSEMVGINDSVLDLGSGLGDLSRFLSERGHVGNYIGIEKDAALFRASSMLYPDLQLFRQDFMEAPFHEADIAICVGGLLSADTLSLESVLAFLKTYPTYILIGISEKSTSSLRLEKSFVGIPDTLDGQTIIKLNDNEVAILHNCKPRTTPIQRLENQISAHSYPAESVARALYALDKKERAIELLRECESELSRAMLSAWQ